MIEVKGLTKRYGHKLAVDDLTFTVRPGIVTGFLGPNGSGKSTTMRLILGLDRPTSGTALVNGHAFAESTAPLHEVGALLDAKDVHGGRTAYKHLRALAESNGISKDRVHEALELTGMQEVAKKRIKGFSLGMSQRLGLAATLLGDPDVFMFDEPVNGLDPEGILWIRNFMRSLAASGRTVLVSSHLMSEMSLTADHLIVIGRGRLMADMSTEDFIKHAGSGGVRVRSPHADTLVPALTGAGGTVDAVDGLLKVTGLTAPQIGDLAAANGATLHELTEERASLEEAFMDMTRDSVEYRADGAPLDSTTMPGAAR